MNKKMKELRQKSMKLPLLPGVYIMKNSKKEIIYIGKAKKLKNRVSQYFGSQNSHPEKVERMVDNVDDFEYIITDTEFEALILECSLIKQHTPKYNILLKDDKGYSYIKVTNEKYRRISYVLQKEDDDATYIGPYKSSVYVHDSVDEAVKIFKLPTCNRKLPGEGNNKRPCLNYHINMCLAPCSGRVKLSEYNEYVESALDFLQGGSTKTINTLKEQMQKASDNLDFERAAKYRDRIKAIKKMADEQKVVDIKEKELDVISLASNKKSGSFEIFRFEESKLYDRENFIIYDIGDEDNAREEFILRYYSMRDFVPKHIIIDGDVIEKDALVEWLSDKKGRKVELTVPQRGTLKNLVDMCKKNAFEALAQKGGITGHQLEMLEEFKNILGLEKVPKYIESYDISNTAGHENVAGMIVFKDAKPYKSAYKTFKIKSFDGQDDYASMAEVLDRRFQEYFKDEEKKTSFSVLPDLILLDGGKGQVSAVKPILEKYNLDIPLFGMVKDDKHRTRAITSEDGEIEIRKNKRIFSFVTSVQDEVHRFAIKFHHKQRKKTISTTLTQVEGVGEKRAKELMRYFRTISNIKKASVEELEGAPSMNHNAAISIYNHFHGEEE